MPSLSDVYVQIRGDTAQMDSDFKQAESKGIFSAQRLEQGFTHHLTRALGVFALLQIGSKSVASGLKQIEEQKILDHATGADALESLLRIHEAQRDIIGDIPILGTVGKAIMESFSDDANIRRTVDLLKQMKGPEEFKAARKEEISLGHKAEEARGVPKAQVRREEVGEQMAELQKQETDLRRQAADAKLLADREMKAAQELRGRSAAQAVFYGGGVRTAITGGPFAGGIPIISAIQGTRQLQDAEAHVAAAQEATSQYQKYRMAAQEKQKSLQDLGVIMAGTRQMAGAGAISAALPPAGMAPAGMAPAGMAPAAAGAAGAPTGTAGPTLPPGVDMTNNLLGLILSELKTGQQRPMVIGN